ncbi:MAG TPA: MotA/TolQ/ExbB proton channel family protein [Spirochaetota bacterium]|nr:MAG: Biopolymer transport protein ExbB [Spirochaetes bacterium ADurb.Bin133]HNZ26944.1 MotA/TolQ/ExbB proton channel family protein [Spirochaetota bacterium]HOF00685.1 MotA/TolQ/ExbB proton channel family protein [Spirochaetota bacterium]HOS33055.1 MotA/TolQ/ExbB proton channel family protein [Spirochaetota bacterium]HOS55907.1 MotA/TolQ/ExbB proton channel family protein [Spirochaetota bacterium]
MFANLFKLFIDGGPVIMSCILICSIVAVVIIIEKFMYINKITKKEEKVIERLSSAINAARYDEALAICDNSPSPVTNMMKAGIKRKDYPEIYIKEAIRDAGSLEIPKLERFLTTLGTIANISTLLGLLGTVQGNMEAFGLIGSKSALGSMEMLAGGISKALLTTAFGLIVSIPTTIFYNYLTNKVNNMILKMETQANELVLVLLRKKSLKG